MMINFFRGVMITILYIAGCSSLMAQTGVSVPKKTLGDPAPALTIERWLKGTPVSGFQKGHVYVLEFWATWCGPCIIGMPHLSELAKKYKDVTIIGVTASEKTEADSAKARAFVEAANDMMRYNVGYAKPKGPMSREWMQATDRKGIPVAYVIDKNGRLAWMGHPLMGLEEAIGLAREDKLTIAAAAAVNKFWDEKYAQGKREDSALKVALNENRIQDALKLNDQVAEDLPFNVPIAAGKKYALLTAIDPKAARAYGEEVKRKYANAPLVLRSIAYTIFEGSDARVLGEIKVHIKGEPDLQLAKALLLQSLKCSAKDRKTDDFLQQLDTKNVH